MNEMDLVADLLGGGRTIAYKADFAHIAGSVTAGVLLSQFWYWSNQEEVIERDGWFWKTRDDIEMETGLSRREQETARKRLVEIGLSEEELRGVPARMWYRLDKAALYRLLKEYAASKLGGKRPTGKADSAQLEGTKSPSKKGRNAPTFKENTTETTPKITTAERAAPGKRVEKPIAPDSSAADLIASLVGEGVNRADALRLAGEHPEECRRQLDYLPFVSEIRSSRGAYLATAIRDGYGPPKAWMEHQQREVEAAQAQRTAHAREAKASEKRRQEEETAARLAEARATLEQDTEAWERIEAEAEKRLPAPLRGKPEHVAYKPALEARINEIVAAMA